MIVVGGLVYINPSIAVSDCMPSVQQNRSSKLRKKTRVRALRKLEVLVRRWEALPILCTHVIENESKWKPRYTFTVSKIPMEGVFRGSLKMHILPVACPKPCSHEKQGLKSQGLVSVFYAYRKSTDS